MSVASGRILFRADIKCFSPTFLLQFAKRRSDLVCLKAIYQTTQNLTVWYSAV